MEFGEQVRGWIVLPGAEDRRQLPDPPLGGSPTGDGALPASMTGATVDRTTRTSRAEHTEVGSR